MQAEFGISWFHSSFCILYFCIFISFVFLYFCIWFCELWCIVAAYWLSGTQQPQLSIFSQRETKAPIVCLCTKQYNTFFLLSFLWLLWFFYLSQFGSRETKAAIVLPVYISFFCLLWFVVGCFPILFCHLSLLIIRQKETKVPIVCCIIYSVYTIHKLEV